MVTVEQILEYAERVIAEDTLSGNLVGLRNAQRALGFMMSAANSAGDKGTAFRCQVLAAAAANKAEALDKR